MPVLSAMSTYYRVDRHDGRKITPALVTRRTGSYIFIIAKTPSGGSMEVRRAIDSTWEKFFPSWEAARDHLLEIAKGNRIALADKMRQCADDIAYLLEAHI